MSTDSVRPAFGYFMTTVSSGAAPEGFLTTEAGAFLPMIAVTCGFGPGMWSPDDMVEPDGRPDDRADAVALLKTSSKFDFDVTTTALKTAPARAPPRDPR